ncbi:MAG: hypothetical protein WKI04_01620 [Ferruginibacter sp.]
MWYSSGNTTLAPAGGIRIKDIKQKDFALDNNGVGSCTTYRFIPPKLFIN